MTAEERRLQESRTHQLHWKKWGPYLSERQWGTVREDYSSEGSAWDYFSHDQARSRAYRWGEDGLAGISDNHQYLCFALALWNGQDSILKERLFGLTGQQGNHGEDVKEYYFYLDNTPTHSYMKYLYKYPQNAFPYTQLVEENQRRSYQDPEFELLDTGVFDDNKYFDIFIEYAKASPDDILIKITAFNRSKDPQVLHLLPTLWFRNTWSWGYEQQKPILQKLEAHQGINVIEADHPLLGKFYLYSEGFSELLFTENETNYQRLFGTENSSNYVKDGINDYVVNGDSQGINPQKVGTKSANHYTLSINPESSQTIRLRLCKTSPERFSTEDLSSNFEDIFAQKQQEADEFYHRILKDNISEDERNIKRQAFAGMLWSKQYYHYVIEEWIKGDPGTIPPPYQRKWGRNSQWIHLHTDDILSMPDKWEYPWFAAWDLAFHAVPLAIVDPEFAKRQLDLMTREWYMHPNGQIPAYEWSFSDVNPPVHAWATWQVYQLEQQIYGRKDRQFLERVFQKLLLNFTWWVNRKDTEGKNIFEGGFLGLDNIGVFDRSSPLPTGGHIEQADSTSWMGMYCLNLLQISLELALENPVYEDIATKFFEHFLYIANAMNHIGDDETQLWDKEDGFFYDVLSLPNGQKLPLKVRSIVGLIPLFAVLPLEPDTLDKLPNFKKRLEWFIRHRSDLKRNVACMETKGMKARRLLALCYVTPNRLNLEDKLRLILTKLLDEQEFLSDYGIRALSKYHGHHPYVFEANGSQYRVSYEPAESSNGLFGGNSNWRGPIWMPVNYLLIESLKQFYTYLGDDFKVECPTGSGNWITLQEVADELSQRLMNIFRKDNRDCRPVYGNHHRFSQDPHWRDLILFFEYFHGEQGLGLGASHQTGWTGLILGF